jgi:DNA-binding response OmpR family regulator
VSAPESKSKMDILIADDDLALAELWERAFLRAGFIVHVVHDGKAAIDYLGRNPLPSAVLVDQMMPGLKGTDVLAELLRIDTYQSVRTIMVTASPESVPPDIHDMVDIFLQKPVSYRDLVTLAQRMTVG